MDERIEQRIVDKARDVYNFLQTELPLFREYLEQVRRYLG